MFKRLWGKALRPLVRRTRTWIATLEGEEREETNRRRNFDQDFTAYPWLHHLFTTLLKEEGRVLKPNYTWGVMQGAHLAKAIGIGRISVLELGVAGGNGLIQKRIAQKVEEIFGMSIDVFGFDTGTGLPKPDDYRDMPNLYAESDFKMDPEKLKKLLKKAHLLLGLVEETIIAFINSRPAPIAFIAFDLDYYTSTMSTFKLLEADHSLILPRIHCYFDDIIGFTHSDYTGERLAISEFNASRHQ